VLFTDHCHIYIYFYFYYYLLSTNHKEKTVNGGCMALTATSITNGQKQLDDKTEPHMIVLNKKLSYRRETARQLPTWREGGVRPFSPLPSAPSGYTYACG